MKRPTLVITIGYIIGILMGLYFKFSIVLFYLPIAFIYYLIKKINRKGHSHLKKYFRYIRYLKITLNKSVFYVIIISSIIANTAILARESTYKKIECFIENQSSLAFSAIIVSNKTEKKYNDLYVAKTRINGKNIKFYVKCNKKCNLKYGDLIYVEGVFQSPAEQRNFGGFNYKQYLKQYNIYATIKASKIDKIKDNCASKFFIQINALRNYIVCRLTQIIPEEQSGILLALIVGDKNMLEEETKTQFSNASMSHILAISGMHINYIVMGLNKILNKKIPKNLKQIILTVFLLVYIILTDFSPSVIRACIMEILVLFSKIIHKKDDKISSLATSLLIILICNPYLISNVGLQLSYSGILGIFLLYKKILNILLNINIKNKFYKYFVRPKLSKIIDNAKKIFSMSISIQIFNFPIILFNYNILNFNFLLSNFILNIVIEPIIIAGFLFIVLLLINIRICKAFASIIVYLINILKFISKISYIPTFKIYLPTPNILHIFAYYFFEVTIINLIYIYNIKLENLTQRRIKNMVAFVKIQLRKKQKVLKNIGIFIIIIFILFMILPQNLKIYFLDVGQGDSTFIVTPHKKTILIDGGNKDECYDYGKSVILPYIFDRGFRSIDFIVISHFDSDHVGGLLTVLEELKVGQVIISKLGQECENYEKFKEIIDRKHIKVLTVGRGDRLKIEKNLYLDMLWPDGEKIISENVLNNNSLVCKFNYKNFSMLFTGDIEEIAEKSLMHEYKNNLNILKSTILKVGHHGSKTTSMQEFLDVVKPQIALIGVGENNKFGHPNEAVIERLEKLGSIVYRTDQKGEIMLYIDLKGKIKVNHFLNECERCINFTKKRIIRNIHKKGSDNMYKKMIALIATIGILLGIVFGLSLYIRNIKRGNLEKSKIQQIDEVAEQLVEDDCTDEWQYLASLYKEEIIANSSESKVSPNCIIEKRIKYNDCGHEIIQRMDVPLELINKTQDDVQKEYEGWHIEKFSEKQIVLIREIDNECGEHFVLKSEDGKITIYKRESDGEKLYLKTEICTDYLPETDKIKIQEGMEINTKDELNKILEDYE